MDKKYKDYKKEQAYLALFKSLEISSLTLDEMRQKINDLTLEMYQKDLIDVRYKLEIVFKRLFISALNFHTGLLFSGIYVPYDELVNVYTVETEHEVFKWRDERLISALIKKMTYPPEPCKKHKPKQHCNKLNARSVFGGI